MRMYGGFARVYDKLMADVDRASWAQYLLALLPAPTGLAVTDCACGTGALTLPLARAGHRLTGVDVSPEMLAVAMEKARGAGLDIPFVRQDIRSLALHRAQDAIVCACDGVNYLARREGAEEFFRAACRALKPGGVLLFDVSSRYKLSVILGNNTFAQDEEEAAYLWRNEYDEARKLLTMELTFFRREADGRYARFAETHVQRAHSQRELTAALSRAGFEDIAVYGAFTFDPPGENAERLQFAARKPLPSKERNENEHAR